jgi:hypothetical protein
VSDSSAQDEAVRKTYRYLRIAIVGMVALLAVSVLIELGWGEGQLGSISAYYYTPVRSMFVGALMAIGLSLIAIRGRDGAEDTLLNLAGMLAPVVALVPTPLSRTGEDGELEGYVPDEHLASIDNNVGALLVVGVVGICFAAWTANRNPPETRRAALIGVAVGVAAFAGFAAWFLFGHDSFVVGAHYLAAVPLFGFVSAVAWINAKAARDKQDDDPVLQMLPAQRRARLYQLIAWAMVATVVVAGVLFALQAAGSTPIPHWLFYVETVLLALFTTFWLLQTAEYWSEAIPDEVAAAP